MGLGRVVRQAVSTFLTAHRTNVNAAKEAYVESVDQFFKGMSHLEGELRVLFERSLFPMYVIAASLFLSAAVSLLRIIADLADYIIAYKKTVAFVVVFAPASAMLLSRFSSLKKSVHDAASTVRGDAAEDVCRPKLRRQGCSDVLKPIAPPLTEPENPLFMLLRRRRFEELFFVLESKAYTMACNEWIQQKGEWSMNLLMIAVLMDTQQAYHKLMSAGSMVVGHDFFGWKALNFAALCQRRTLFKDILKCGAMVRTLEWPLLVEAAMELEPATALHERLSNIDGPHHRSISSSDIVLARAAKAWSFIHSNKLTALVDLGGLKLQVRRRLVARALRLRDLGHRQCFDWLTCHAVCNIDVDLKFVDDLDARTWMQNLNVLDGTSLSAATTCSEVDAEGDAKQVKKQASGSFLAFSRANCPDAVHRKSGYPELKDASPGTVYNVWEYTARTELMEAEAQRLFLSGGLERPFDVVWKLPEAPPAWLGSRRSFRARSDLSKRKMTQSVTELRQYHEENTKLVGASPEQVEKAEEQVCILHNALVQGGYLLKPTMWRSSVEARMQEVLLWAEAHPGRILLILEDDAALWPTLTDLFATCVTVEAGDLPEEDLPRKSTSWDGCCHHEASDKQELLPQILRRLRRSVSEDVPVGMAEPGNFLFRLGARARQFLESPERVSKTESERTAKPRFKMRQVRMSRRRKHSNRRCEHNNSGNAKVHEMLTRVRRSVTLFDLPGMELGPRLTRVDWQLPGARTSRKMSVLTDHSPSSPSSSASEDEDDLRFSQLSTMSMPELGSVASQVPGPRASDRILLNHFLDMKGYEGEAMTAMSNSRRKTVVLRDSRHSFELHESPQVQPRAQAPRPQPCCSDDEEPRPPRLEDWLVAASEDEVSPAVEILAAEASTDAAGTGGTGGAL